jgi:hypothetical protein
MAGNAAKNAPSLRATSTAYINNNVYAIVNAVNSQANGLSPVTVLDTASFIDFGKSVLSSNDATETFTQTLLLMMAATYTTWRPYESSLRDLMVSGEEWGAIYQKIDAEVPEFTSDESFELVDGQSVDQYVVRKPTAKQKLFVKRATYSNYVTIVKKQLQGAFRSEAEFAKWSQMIFGKMRIKLDFAAENMARLAIASYIANCGTTQIRHLLTEYNTESGRSLTQAESLLDEKYLAFVAGEMELYSKRLRNLSTSYNTEGAERHTPRGEQKFLIYDKLQSRLQTVVQFNAYHKELVELKEFIEVPYWQGEQDRTTIKVTVDDGQGGTEQKVVENVLGFIFDRYALGTFRYDEDMQSSPINARGRFINVFYFSEQLWYNDLSENGVCFCND